MAAAVRACVFDVGGVIAYDVWENMIGTCEGGGGGGCSVVQRFPGIDRAELFKWMNHEWHLFSSSGCRDDRTADAEELKYWTDFTTTFAKELPVDTRPNDLMNMSEPFLRFVDGVPALLDDLKDARPDILLGICSNNVSFFW
eukprot:TRINITY_DN2014_c0_g1_i2.p1 TRINITY_DN2014_c0_g1~~TRINITY_DN2014_c0_g1_i2.p1  ORF type:complete len:157 (+),score=38.70 TRINITY_DN2014_c0_g1_i2:46-471(+)